MDNVATFLVPSGLCEFTVAICEDPDAKSVEVNMATTLPPLWNGKYVGHFHTLNAYDKESAGWGFTPDFIAELQLTHLALLESSFGEAPAFFFNGEAIMHNSLLLWYSEPRHKFYFIHCGTCARGLVNWMLKHQEEWMSSAPAPTSVTLN